MSDAEHDEEDEDDVEAIIVNMQIEFYLKNREDPLQCYMAVGIAKEAFADDHGVVRGLWKLMEEASESLVMEMDSKGTPYLFVTDKRMNRMIIMTDEIQSVSVLAPDQDTVIRALEEDNESE